MSSSKVHLPPPDGPPAPEPLAGAGLEGELVQGGQVLALPREHLRNARYLDRQPARRLSLPCGSLCRGWSCSLRGHYPTGSKGQRRGLRRRYLSPLSREPPFLGPGSRSVAL